VRKGLGGALFSLRVDLGYRQGLTAKGAMKPGSTLNGTYEIVRRISEGGMGEIYEARHVRLTGSYAVKVLRPEIRTRDESAFARFRREAEVTSSLRHPHIVQVIDFNETPEGAPYFVMELLAGDNLAARLAAQGPLPLSDVVVIVEQVASALQAAHDRGIVHRDLKPENLHLEPVAGRREPYVKVLDFGISKVLAASALTQEFTLVGTPYYMSPEQARGKGDDVDGRTDQFALATIAHELLTGKRAFEADEVYAILFRVIQAAPTSLVPLVGEAVDAVIARAMSKARDERFPNVTAFAEALRAAAFGPPQVTGAWAAPRGPTGSVPVAASSATGHALAPTVVPNSTATLAPPTATSTMPVRARSRRGVLLVGGLVVALAAAGAALWVPRGGPTWRPGDAAPTAQAALVKNALTALVEEERGKAKDAVVRAAQIPELSNALLGRVDEATFQDLLDTEIWWTEMRAFGAAIVGPQGVTLRSHLPPEVEAAALPTTLPVAAGDPNARAGWLATSTGAVIAAAAPLGRVAGSWLVLTRTVDRALVTQLGTRANLVLLLSDGKQPLALSVPEATVPEIGAIVGHESEGVLVDGHRKRLAVAVPLAGPLWLWGMTSLGS